MKPASLPLTLIAAALLLTACQNTGPRFDPHDASLADLSGLTPVGPASSIDPEWLTPPTDFFTIGPGDHIEIEMLGDPESRSTALVGPDGKVYYHLLPGLDIWGLTIAEATSLLERELARFVTEPRVAITLRAIQSKRVWLLGRVGAPGIYTMTSPMTLLEAISLAGGTAATTGVGGTTLDLADLRHSFLIRDGQLLPINFYELLREGNMAHNIYLHPEDFVFVPSALSQEIYVMGAVGRPGSVPYSDDLTLVAAISSRGGTAEQAYISHVAIVRGSLADPRIAIVDYRDIIRGRAPDVRLQPRDIVYVPLSPYRTLTRYADLIVRSFVRVVAANEGVRAVSDSAPLIRPNVPVGGD
jgi:protein involved in polysaccharide export with SLBB domain